MESRKETAFVLFFGLLFLVLTPSPCLGAGTKPVVIPFSGLARDFNGVSPIFGEFVKDGEVHIFPGEGHRRIARIELRLTGTHPPSTSINLMFTYYEDGTIKRIAVKGGDAVVEDPDYRDRLDPINEKLRTINKGLRRTKGRRAQNKRFNELVRSLRMEIGGLVCDLIDGNVNGIKVRTTFPVDPLRDIAETSTGVGALLLVGTLMPVLYKYFQTGGIPSEFFNNGVSKGLVPITTLGAGLTLAGLIFRSYVMSVSRRCGPLIASVPFLPSKDVLLASWHLWERRLGLSILTWSGSDRIPK